MHGGGGVWGYSKDLFPDCKINHSVGGKYKVTIFFTGPVLNTIQV